MIASYTYEIITFGLDVYIVADIKMHLSVYASYVAELKIWNTFSIILLIHPFVVTLEIKN